MTTSRLHARASRRRVPSLRALPAPVGGLVVLVVALQVLAAGLEWHSSLTAATSVELVLAVGLCLVGRVEALAGARPLLTPLVAVATAQAVLLATPLPLLDPANRLAIQGGLLWVVVLCAQRAEFPRPWAGSDVRTWAQRWGRAVVAGAQDWRMILLLGLMGLAVGTVAAAALVYHPITRERGAGLVLELVVVAVLQAAPEEYLFRGLLTPALSRTVGPLTPLVDGVLFASVYGASRSWPLLALVLVSGMAASWVRRRFGSAAPTVAAHVSAAVVALALVPHLP